MNQVSAVALFHSYGMGTGQKAVLSSFLEYLGRSDLGQNFCAPRVGYGEHGNVLNPVTILIVDNEPRVHGSIITILI
ncbi:hypothetical protein CI610_02942 [invertebrate metagenome]|uniref:Uncharacterized protein n=1 Tax=invertebrate metagenome TaxID=1711999 RepID=A0A2H9T4J9_9ZZZZ